MALPTDGRVLWPRSQPAPAMLAVGVATGRGSVTMEMVAGGTTMGVMAAGVVMEAAATATGMGGGGAGGFGARCLDGAALAGAGGCGSATSNTDSLMVGGVGVDSCGDREGE